MTVAPSAGGPASRRTAAHTRRRYRSPLREQRAAETRQALITAAHQLFVANGWTATGMRDIAVEAGVATETVYAYFPSKRALLQAVIDIAVVGDELPVAVVERPEFAAMGRGRHTDRAAASARLLRGIHERTAAFAKVMREAAASDDEMADALRATRERQRRDVATGLRLIMGRDPTPAERDGAWAITSPEIYSLLVEDSGWAPAQYEAWMGEVLERIVPRSSNARSARQ